MRLLKYVKSTTGAQISQLHIFIYFWHKFNPKNTPTILSCGWNAIIQGKMCAWCHKQSKRTVGQPDRWSHMRCHDNSAAGKPVKRINREDESPPIHSNTQRVRVTLTCSSRVTPVFDNLYNFYHNLFVLLVAWTGFK